MEPGFSVVQSLGALALRARTCILYTYWLFGEIKAFGPVGLRDFTACRVFRA